MADEAAGDGEFGVIVEKGQLALEAIGMHDVVGVHDEDPLGGGELDGSVEGVGRAGVGLAEDFDAGIGLGKRLGDGERVVGRAVVDDDEFEVGPGLTESAGNGVVEEGLSVIGGHYDRDSHSLALLLLGGL